MKKQSTFLYVLRLALTLLLITSCMAAALAGVNALTKDRITAITKEKTDKAIREVLPDTGFVFTDSMEKHQDALKTDIVKTLYTAYNEAPSCTLDGGHIIGYAVEVVPSGFDGEITMIVGFDTQYKITGISIISHTETAGLGAVAAANNASGEAFRNQFVGKSGELAVTKDGGEVDAITGATITSRAVVEGVNAATECMTLISNALKG
jgi:electron transport complex protein RnfG